MISSDPLTGRDCAWAMFPVPMRVVTSEIPRMFFNCFQELAKMLLLNRLSLR